jgi:hypothetical protein
MSVSNNLLEALTQLAKAGMAFTNEIEPDGKEMYVVDSIRLTEDELILLNQKGALTRDGIRHHLVNRAA